MHTEYTLVLYSYSSAYLDLVDVVDGMVELDGLVSGWLLLRRLWRGEVGILGGWARRGLMVGMMTRSGCNHRSRGSLRQRLKEEGGESLQMCLKSRFIFFRLLPEST